MTFSSSSQRVYTVQCSTDQANENWSDVLIDEPGTGERVYVGVTNQSDRAFYRVSVKVP